MLTNGIESIEASSLEDHFHGLDRETRAALPPELRDRLTELEVDLLRNLPEHRTTCSFIGFAGTRARKSIARLRAVDHVAALVQSSSLLKSHALDVLAAAHVAPSERAAIAMFAHVWAQAFVLGYETRAAKLATAELDRIFHRDAPLNG